MARKVRDGGDDRGKSRRIGALAGLWPFIRPYRMIALGALVALTVTAAVSLALPIAVRRVVDGFGSNPRLLDGYFGAALAIAALLAIGTGARFYLVSRLGERVVADIRRAVFDKVIGLGPTFHATTMSGETVSRLTTDTTVVMSVIGSSVSVALRNILLLLGGLALMVATSAKLTGLVLLIVPVVVVPIVVMGRRLRRLSRESQDWIADSSGRAAEALSAVETVQAFGREPAVRAAFGQATEDAYGAARARIGTRAVMTAIVIFLVFAGVVGVLWIGARDVREGLMTIGALVQFVIYAVLVAGSVGALSETWGELQRAAGATERLMELLSIEDAIRDPAHPRPLPRPVRGAVDFDHVSFSYPGREDRSAVSEIALSIRPGETVALVGPSGAGKSTLIQLLLRFHDPQAGAVRIDGIDLRDMARADFRAAIGYVPQAPVIFAASARENIRFGREGATDAEVEAAARAAAAHDFIAALPTGYDTALGERGVTLSGGQRQRIAIARAILRNAPILVLDEATSALDAESERAVQEAVGRLAQGRTTLVVAHRLATVKKADRIVVLDQGRILAEGTHDALVAQGGLYARLARLQFGDRLAAAE